MTRSFIEIGRLCNVNPREPWQNEARHFTPWLAAHIDQLGDAIGLKLELTDTEVRVEDFSADILARNAFDGTRVLIENQLEATDHKHLGQILTYLAGLDANTVVWIATEFREAHLSAIKWLNDHTDSDCNFFGVRLRVVRIAESPVAPIFDVLERPNGWERQLQSAARNSQESAALAEFRKSFWTAYLQRLPDDKLLGFEVTGTSSNWLPADPEKTIFVSVWVGKRKIGVFVRGPRGCDGSELANQFNPIRQQLEQKLGAKYGRTTGANFFDSTVSFDMSDKAIWPEAIDWMHRTATNYLSALREVLR